MRRLQLGGVLLAALVGGAAQAHSPYLLPNDFDATGRDHVTVQASFTEHMFVPDIAMKSDDFHVVGPDGARVAVTPVYLRDLAVFEAPTPVDGTWRITSGQRVGRTAKAVFEKGEWVFLDPEKPLPPGAKAVEMQSLTTAETYVSRGAPTTTALAPLGKGLEFHAITHPDSIFAGEDATFEVLLDGKPLPNQFITLVRGDERYAEKAKPVEVVSDAAGKFVIRAPQVGVYLAMTRYRIAPKGDEAGRSLTYALTFEAAR